MKRDLASVAAAAALALGSCCLAAQQAPPVFITDAAAERIPNLRTLKNELREYHDCTCTCGCWAHDIDKQADRAIVYLRQRAAHRRPAEKLALILDVDETMLSNYQQQSDADFGYVPKDFNVWLESAKAPAISGTLRLYKEAQRLGVSIFIITGRLESQRPATERDLHQHGYDGWQQLAMHPDVHGSETIGQFKATVRGQIAASGYTLALSVGDMWSDLKGKPEAEFSVKYPDPYDIIP